MANHRLCFCFCVFILLFFLLPSPSLQQSPKLNFSDLKALFAIKNSLTSIYNTRNSFFSTWDFTSPDPCSSFSGVTCSLLHPSSLRVTILSLGNSPGLAGSLPAAISGLTELTQLILAPGIVTGSIPPEIGKLAKLRVISLPSNRFTGSIPATFSSLNCLHTLDLSHNQLTGSVPPGLTELPELKVLILAFNSISGELSPISSQLLHLDLKNNVLTGPLPPSLPSSLRYLSLSNNRMWGPLNGLATLTELTFLDLSMNQFSGTIPGPLFFIPSLSSLFLQRNNLSGGIPQKDQGPLISTPPSYGQGSIVDLSHNFLTGELSTVLDGVESLFLNNNRLMGTVPEEYAKSVCRGSTKTLYLQHNYLTGFPHPDVVPDTASLCLSYNCMVPPLWGVMTCPASSGGPMSRPTAQCSVFNNGSSKG
ncbi:leucine-rich repeat receptor-like serine/threonine-protein kinase BAM2 [Prosopis cineraria]|uniref:leucine-rich repeat receptor-like serine/threonine-protein kinase BAM2 n=1 Tax=Prosopis cineraria TaxID=364024 RepID=UPI0024104FD5|nr:leucine-rich repeat receptor-like serine/threonine-protein kinase BAM2 [Prosopis cineraria]